MSGGGHGPGADRERAIEEELDFYLELRAKEIQQVEGVRPEEALRRARERFGDRERIASELGAIGTRHARRAAWRHRFESIVQDVRFAVRALARRPGFTVTAVATLALGIGATTAIFGVADAALLRQPAVRAPAELAMVYTTCRNGDPRCTLSWPDYLSYRERSTTLAGLAAYTFSSTSISTDEGADVLGAFLISGNFFEVLGVSMALGRPIQQADEDAGGADPVAVLDHALWRDRFGSDRGILGRTLRLDGASFTVVGVAPESFRGVDLGGPPDVYVPLTDALALLDGRARDASLLDSRAQRWIARAVGRRAPGTTVEQVRGELETIAGQLAADYPDLNEGRSVTVDPLDGYVRPTNAGAGMTRFVMLLSGVVGFTLLLACANLANLLLARATARRREMGIRVALGAGGGRLVRQLLTEAVLLAVVGGAAGLAVAWALFRALSAFALPGGVAISQLNTGLDGRLLVFAFALSVLTGVLFGLIPALQGGRADVVSALKDGARGASVGGGLRTGLVALQVALCLILLVGSGLFLRSLGNAMGTEKGYDPDGLALATFDVSAAGYDGDPARALSERILARTAGLPGVQATALAMRAPLEPGGFGTFIEVPGYQPAAGEDLRIEYNFVTPGFFDAVGATVVRGRGLLPTDTRESGWVALINESMAARWWPDRDALGSSFQLGSREVRVVGIARDMEWFGLESPGTAFVTMPLTQGPAPQRLTLLARTAGDTDPLLNAIQDVVRAVDREVPLLSMGTLREQLGQVLMPQRMGATLLTLFGALALLLAAVGIYGVVSFTVGRTRREIGIRMALGAGRGRVLATVIRTMLAPVALGLGAGVIAALALTRLVGSFMYGVQPDDPLTFAFITALLAAVALVSALLPARRATRVDPAGVLREE
ncbi:MAG: ABC transporter permease [Gemmatimonadota bacterium]